MQHTCEVSRKIRNINQAVEYLIECYNEDVSLKELSRIANLSPYHFIRVFKAYMGKTPYQYLVDIKIKKSMELLKSSRFTITEISSMCEFAHPMASLFIKPGYAAA